MMNEYLVVVDMQNDFIDGALGTPEAVKIVSGVRELVRTFAGEIIFTRDTHKEGYLETEEGRHLPVPHCIINTHGWELDGELKELVARRDCLVIDKPTFGSQGLGEYLAAKNRMNKIDKITLVGLCTDICVISNALLIKAFLPEVEIEVDASLCAGVNPESHARALECMKVCQISVKNA